MRETIEAYLARQAATVGIKVAQITCPLWVPHLAGAKGHCLGMIEGNYDYKKEKGRRYNCCYGIALLPDRHAMVTGNMNGQLHCYNLETGALVWQNSHESYYIEDYIINYLAFSPCGNLLATSSKDLIRIWDAASGQCLQRFDQYGDYQDYESYDITIKVRWSPDGTRLACGYSDPDSSTASVAVLNINTSKWELNLIADEVLHTFDWSPDGQFIFSGGWRTNCLWNATTGEKIASYNLDSLAQTCEWSPNGRYLAIGTYFDYSSNYDTEIEGGKIYIWDAATHSEVLQWINHGSSVNSVAWSPDGHLLASASEMDERIRIWNTRNYQEIERFLFPHNDSINQVIGLFWSSDGAFLVSSHLDDYFRFWDTRHLLSSQTFTTFDPNPTKPLPTHFRLLPTALAQMHRLGIYPPLSLVQDLLNLTGGQLADNPLAQLATDNGISELIALFWSAPARIGLVALLLHKIPFPDWEPPSGISPREISNALQAGLKGEPIEPQAPPTPISPLQEAAKLIDDRLLCLLTILGEQAVAAEPALPLRLLSRIPNLPALNSLQRQLLGVRVCLGDHTGRSIGNTPGAERGQVSGVETSSRTDWSSLLPTQLALPQTVLNYRYQRGELLFRTRELAEPPRLRPTVLLLDVTPPVFGPIEAITRIAAFAMANFLRQADIPIVLITTGEEQEQILQLDNPQDLVEIWTYRAMSPANEVRSLKLANAIRTNLLDESGLEPIILLLTHPWFGAESKLSRVQGLRGLFVQYPNMQVKPAIADLCERYSYIDSEQTADLGQILGYLMG
ncbi:hypothetical protein [Nostoc sp.]|uniref:hypothetical protein n=1 Tax=Nostoc sp. TaxID=1180 RepID=UPI002FFA3EAD